MFVLFFYVIDSAIHENLFAQTQLQFYNLSHPGEFKNFKYNFKIFQLFQQYTICKLSGAYSKGQRPHFFTFTREKNPVNFSARELNLTKVLFLGATNAFLPLFYPSYLSYPNLLFFKQKFHCCMTPASFLNKPLWKTLSFNNGGCHY